MANSNDEIVDSRFFIRGGKTYLNYEDRFEEFGDFTLKLIGEISGDDSRREGYWVASCGVENHLGLETRIVVLPAGCFDSKSKFNQELRRRFRGGTFNLSGHVSTGDLVDFYSSLKEDYKRGPPRFFKACTHHGQQEGPNYWVLNENLHIQDGKVLEKADHLYYPIEDLGGLSTDISADLLQNNSLEQVCNKFLRMSEHFQANTEPFKQAMSFLLLRNLRSGREDTWLESTIGALYSIKKNVGKSFTLDIMSKGQGLPTRIHPLLCAGGNQHISGTTVKMLLNVLASSTMALLVDDPKITESLGDFLLAVQSGLTQGSSSSGNKNPLGSVFVTTNTDPESLDRLKGRAIKFQYVHDPTFKEIDNQQLMEMSRMTDVNRGFLIAWIVKYNSLFDEEIIKEPVATISGIIERLLTGRQPRWYKAVSQMLYTYAVFHITSGVKPEVGATLLAFVQDNIASKEEQPVSERLQVAIQSKLATAQYQALRWLSPQCSVMVSGKFVPAYGISNSTLDEFSNVGKDEIMKELAKQIDRVKAQSITFAACEEASVMDVSARVPGKTKSCKGLKFPQTMFDHRLIKHMDYACKKTNDEPGALYQPETSTMGNPELNTVEAASLICVVSDIEEALSALKAKSGGTPHEEERLKELSPASKLNWSGLTPRRKRVYEEGMRSGLRIAERANRSVETMDDSYMDATPSTSTGITDLDAQESERDISTRRSLPFNRSVSGSIGVYKRHTTKEAHQSHKSKQAKHLSKDICHQCKRKLPKGHGNTDILWTKCDGCQMWYHNACVDLEDEVETSTDLWYCLNCNKE